MSRISDESLDKIQEEDTPVFKELPGVKGSDESTIPLTASGTEEAGVSDSIANGSHPRVPYGEKLRTQKLPFRSCCCKFLSTDAGKL